MNYSTLPASPLERAVRLMRWPLTALAGLAALLPGLLSQVQTLVAQHNAAGPHAGVSPSASPAPGPSPAPVANDWTLDLSRFVQHQDPVKTLIWRDL